MSVFVLGSIKTTFGGCNNTSLEGKQTWGEGRGLDDLKINGILTGGNNHYFLSNHVPGPLTWKMIYAILYLIFIA